MEKSKRNALIAAFALVAIIAVGAVAYQALGVKETTPTTSAAPSATENTAATEATGTAGPAVATENDGGTDDADQPENHGPTVYTEDGSPKTLLELADSKPLVINIWATWCPYCVQEMPDFKELYQEYGDRVSFAFVNATDGRRETVEGAATWLRDNDFAELPAYYDTSYEASAAFGARTLPTTAIISAEGQLISSAPGAIDPTQMRAVLDELLQ